MAPVSGKVTKGGSPVAGATVTFVGSNYTAMGVTSADGAYSLATRGQAGANPGDYKVTVSKIAVAPAATPASTDPAAMAKAMEEAKKAGPPKSELPEKYSNPDQSGLTFTVKADGPNTFDINIQE